MSVKFECCVCYGDGTSKDEDIYLTGKIMTKCKHEICAICYTKIILKDGRLSLCPLCRQSYCKQEISSEQAYANQIESLIEILRPRTLIHPILR
jgi:hypothetical protein